MILCKTKSKMILN
uniref:Uncharacterized protein n=1 Tax=Arundo donax TaxID=35708 RepID=A0A0A9AKJ4_ARUDO